MAGLLAPRSRAPGQPLRVEEAGKNAALETPYKPVMKA
jgi:hypothetical protein